jgi:hypothetical protein
VTQAMAGLETWDLSQERALIENLLCQRFNFLLVFYSLIVAGAFTTSSQRNFNIVLTVGAIISSLFALPIARAQHKLDLNTSTSGDIASNASGTNDGCMGLRSQSGASRHAADRAPQSTGCDWLLDSASVCHVAVDRCCSRLGRNFYSKLTHAGYQAAGPVGGRRGMVLTTRPTDGRRGSAAMC